MKVDLEQLPKARLEFVQPMLAKPSDHLPSGAGWSYELKLDGYRSLVMKHNRRVTLRHSRFVAFRDDKDPRDVIKET